MFHWKGIRKVCRTGKVIINIHRRFIKGGMTCLELQRGQVGIRVKNNKQ